MARQDDGMACTTDMHLLQCPAGSYGYQWQQSMWAGVLGVQEQGARGWGRSLLRARGEAAMIWRGREEARLRGDEGRVCGYELAVRRDAAEG